MRLDSDPREKRGLHGPQRGHMHLLRTHVYCILLYGIRAVQASEASLHIFLVLPGTRIIQLLGLFFYFPARRTSDNLVSRAPSPLRSQHRASEAQGFLTTR